MEKNISTINKSISKEYTKKLFLLTYIPAVVILFFSIFNMKDGIKNLNEAKDLQNQSYKTIAQFYELSYLQEERFWSLLYILKANNENLENLTKQYSISYEYINDIDPNYAKILPAIRTKVISKNNDFETISTFYSDSIENFIKKIIYKKNTNYSNTELNTIIRSTELILKLSENYYKLNILLLKNNPNNEKLNKILENINFLKTFIIPTLTPKFQEIYKNLLESKSIQDFDKYINNKEIYQIDDLIKLNENLKNDFFNLNNYVTENMQEFGEDFYYIELNKIISILFINFFIILFLSIFSFRLKNSIIKNIDDNMNEIEKKSLELSKLHEYINQYVILTKTDLKGYINYASDAFCNISKYSKEEVFNKPHNIVRHPDMPKEVYKELWQTIKKGEIWTGEIKNLAKDKNYYWTRSTVGPTFDNNNNIIGYTSVRQDITQEKYAQYLNEQVTTLLDNANNGFISFDKNLIIKDAYSKKSLYILSQDDLKELSISEALFYNNEEKKEIFEFGIRGITEANNSLQKEILLTLLPQENSINGITFSIKYKIINDKEFMVILEDITETNRLKEKIEYENRIQKMIVAIATRKSEFIELKNSFFDFITDLSVKKLDRNSIEENFLNITKSLHTFKGLFAQEELVNTTQALHELESKIIKLYKKNILTNEVLNEILNNNSLKDSFNSDLDFIAQILGKEFLEPNTMIKLDAEKFKLYENKVISLFDNDKQDINSMENLLKDFLNLNQKSLKMLLDIYPKRVENIAQRLNKKINPLRIVGDENITVRNSYQDFIKNLVHIFRNIVDHGIELPEDRVNMNKYEKGTILCQFKLVNQKEIELVISDDGKGIDANIIRAKAIEKGIMSEEEALLMDDEKLINLIFKDNFSTKENSDLISGRGIGLSALTKELEKINGSIRVESEVNIGSRFIIRFPALVNMILYKSTIQEQFLDSLLEITKTFLTNNIHIDFKEIENKSIFDFKNYYSIIKISTPDYEILALFSCDLTILDNIIKIFIDAKLADDEKLGMYQSLCDESLNTILGNCLSSNNNKYQNFEFSAPLAFDKTIIENMIKKNKFLSKNMESSFGNFNLALIIIN